MSAEEVFRRGIAVGRHADHSLAGPWFTGLPAGYGIPVPEE